MMCRRFAVPALFCCAFVLRAAGQETSAGRSAVTIAVRLSDDSLVFVMPHRFIEPLSDSVMVQGGRILQRGREYSFRYAAGVLTLTGEFRASWGPATASLCTLRVSYHAFPIRLSASYARNTLTVLRDTSAADSIAVRQTPPSFDLEEIFGRDLRKSGSLTRGFTVGSNRDLSLTSGFRMELAGKIAADVDVAASLTDENTPIQPEGNTQTLQEFDNVFVEIRSTSYAATLGDFTLDMGGTEFGRLTRKVQGARGTASLRGETVSGDAVAAGAVTRGKFQTNVVQGLEGVQGPYRLTGRNGERAIIVIAGTEKVYVDGELQVRGETNDYVIDYSTGEVRFSARRLISAASRIVVDFEYADRRFSRSLAAVRAGGALPDARASLSVSYYREADDPDAPIDLTLSDSARAVLSAAGDDPSRAVLDGVTRVDSNGQYLRIDSLAADGTPLTFYRFDPGNPLALYNVTFSFVGAGRGDYVRSRPGEFTWTGRGTGEYLPVILLPFAQSQDLIDISGSIAPFRTFTLGGEFARSAVDVNRFSTADAVRGGHALNFTAAFSPRSIQAAGIALGDLDVTLRERFVDSHFTPMDRTNDVEFNRKWGIDSLDQDDEEIREATLRSVPVAGLVLGGEYGRITRSERFHSVRTAGSLSLQHRDMPEVQYTIERIKSDDRSAGTRGLWVRQRGSSSWSLAAFTPSFRFEAEDRKLRPTGSDSLTDAGFQFRLFSPGLAVRGPGRLSLSGEFEWRTDDRAAGGTMLRESRSFTQMYTGRLSGPGPVTSTLDLTLRKRTFTQPFRTPANPDVRSVLVRSQTRVSPWEKLLDADILYQVSTERSSRLQRTFVRVARGSGSYRYRGDLNGNGLADEEEFEPVRFDGDFTPVTLLSDELVPVIDLKTALRLRIQPSPVLGSETYVRIEENSTEPELKKVYLLHFSSFQNETTTLVGSSLFSHDFLLMEGDPVFSARLRFLQRRGLTRFSPGIERSFARERSVRVRWQFIPEIAGQVDLVNRNDRVAAGAGSTRTRDVTSDGMTLDFAYRPDQVVEVGWKLDLAHASDASGSPPLTSDFNGQTFRVVYAFLGAGQARLEAAREEVVLNRGVDVIPFELTGGRVAGKTWLWRVAADYRVTRFLQATANYDGRVEGGGPPVHTARAEVRAFF